MPYTINKYNGAQIAVVADGTIDNTTDLKLIGKNYAGYGEVQNENFLFLLENFANNNPPPRPISGQIWYDSTNSKLKFYDGNKFRTTGGAEIGATAPTGLTVGDFWFDTANKQLYAWDGAAFILVGPQGVAGSATTQMRSVSVKDTLGANHAIITAVTNGQTIFTVSPDAEFTLDPVSSAITGFTKVHQGVTLAYTNDDNQPGETTSNHRFWGTASNSERLGGYEAGDFIRGNLATFATLVSFSDVGFTVGETPKLRVFNTANTTPTIQNELNDTILFQTKTGGNTTYPLTLKGSNLLPGGTAPTYYSDNVNDIGSASARFKTVHAVTFSGTATQSDSLSVGGTYRTASVASSPNTIVARDASSNVSANLFSGTATSAQYADLAEKYLADAEYEPGTVVVVGGEKEVTASSWGQRPIGAVSTDPAFMMNKDLEGGIYIALKGRVPVKVIGSVKKGDRLVAGNNGTAVAAVPHANDVFAIALEDNQDTSIKLVECVIL